LTEGKRSKRSKKGSGEDANGGGDGEGSDDVIDAPKPKADDDDDDTNWTADISEEAVRARMQDLTDGAKCITFSDYA
jgi:translation initiation factor 5